MAAESAPPRRAGSAWQRLVRSFRWHARAFVALNAVLALANAFVGSWWWAFWPLIVTGFVLGLHYLLYKAGTVDEQWAAERAEELNLKSYDRSHIEDLKSRYRAHDDDRRA
jgi:hypothetical protein